MKYGLIKMLLFSRICKGYALCWQFARPPLGLVICLEGTVCSCTHSYDLSQQRIQSKTSKGKRHMGQNPEETKAQASENLLPVGSYRVCLIPPATDCDSTCEMSTREAH